MGGTPRMARTLVLESSGDYVLQITNPGSGYETVDANARLGQEMAPAIRIPKSHGEFVT